MVTQHNKNRSAAQTWSTSRASPCVPASVCVCFLWGQMASLCGAASFGVAQIFRLLHHLICCVFKFTSVCFSVTKSEVDRFRTWGGGGVGGASDGVIKPAGKGRTGRWQKRWCKGVNGTCISSVVIDGGNFLWHF